MLYFLTISFFFDFALAVDFNFLFYESDVDYPYLLVKALYTHILYTHILHTHILHTHILYTHMAYSTLYNKKVKPKSRYDLNSSKFKYFVIRHKLKCDFFGSRSI
uniref:Secreted protein n=1 Tax=Cacopsylla melanoneura TaxID=428564 RepID=A0A8D9AZI2_9HEMI